MRRCDSGTPAGPRAGQQLAELFHARRPLLIAGQQRIELAEHFVGRAVQRGQPQHGLGLGLRRAGLLLHFLDHVFGADLGQLVERSQDRGGLSGQVEFFEQAVEHQAIVDVNRELGEADRAQQFVDDECRFDVGHDAGRADRVEVTLHELAIATALRVLASPDGGNVIALEGRTQFRGVLRHEPAKGTVRSKRMPTARPPWSTNWYSCRSVSSLPLPVRISRYSSAGVSMGLNPYER